MKRTKVEVKKCNVPNSNLPDQLTLPDVSLRVIAVRSDALEEFMPLQREGILTYEADCRANNYTMAPNRQVQYRVRIEDEKGNSGNFGNMILDQFGKMLELICICVNDSGTEYFPRYVETKVRI